MILETLMLTGIMVVSAELWFRYRLKKLRYRLVEEFISCEQDSKVQIIAELVNEEVLLMTDDDFLIGYKNNKTDLLKRKSCIL